MEAFKRAWAALNEQQRERIRNKARWEGCTLSAVYRDWPSLFEAEAREVSRG